MNTNTIYCFNRLKAAAEAGDIDILYTVIQDDPSILDIIDSIQFVETPLHTAASMGHLEFASEIMILKPSFAWKLNQQGFSPIHLAMQHGQTSMVTRFVKINKDLVRVQGRGGLTPLHIASQTGEVELLASFLFACPESIEYLTVRFDTALHIAIKNEQYEALRVLVRWLRSNIQIGARKLENKILNQRDEAGNTILHISALNSEPQALRLLVNNYWIKFSTKNLEEKTALDIATTEENKSILISAGAEFGSRFPVADQLLSYTLYMGKMFTSKFVFRNGISQDERNTWLIISTLVATATYQSVLTPPAGIYQMSAGDNNLNITSSNSSTPGNVGRSLFNSSNSSIPGNVGRSVLSAYAFGLFLCVNMVSFLVSIMVIYILTPKGVHRQSIVNSND